MSPAEYWRVQQQMATEFAESVDLERVPTTDEIVFADRDLKEEIYWLERSAFPQKIHAQLLRRNIWDDLIRANTYAAVAKVCKDWSQLSDVRASGFAPFPEHVCAHAGQFLSMKRNSRFPRSNYGDDARLDHLARGMAGVLVGVSPMTAIERLRNLKHASGGSLWSTGEHRCNCWRCRLRSSDRASKTT